MNILLVNPPLNNKYAQPPLGLLSLGTVLKTKGHNVKIIDLNISKDARQFDADVCGFSIVSQSYEISKTILQYIKDNSSQTRLIVGGAHPSALPEQVMQELGVNAVVIGEGEQSIFKALETDGIIRPENLVEMDDLPMPDYALLDLTQYHPHPPHGRQIPFSPMLTSRGCPFDCLFCAKSVFGRKYRCFSAERVIAEIEYLKWHFGIKEVAFYDDVFTLDRKRVMRICELLISRNLKISWSCETRVDLVDRELLEAMSAAGCFGVAFGIESGTKEILDYLNKGVEYYQVYKAVKEAHELGLDTTGYFMFVPGMETDESIEETILLAKRLNMDYVQFSKMTPLPGSRVYKVGDKYGSYVSFGGGTADDIDLAIKRAYREYYFSQQYITKRCLKSIKSIEDLKMTYRGLRMMYGG